MLSPFQSWKTNKSGSLVVSFSVMWMIKKLKTPPDFLNIGGYIVEEKGFFEVFGIYHYSGSGGFSQSGTPLSGIPGSKESHKGKSLTGTTKISVRSAGPDALQ